MKHLLVTNDFPPKLGGIQSYLWELWRRLDPDDVCVLSTPHQGDREFDGRQGYRVERTRDPVLLPHPLLARQINRLADDHGAELVLLDPALPIGAIGPVLSSPYGLILHGAEITVPGRLWPGRLALGPILRRASLVVAAGHYPLAEAERAAGRTLASVVVPPGVDPVRFSPVDLARRAELRHDFGLPATGSVVASVSRLVPRKGMDVTIRAVARCAQQGVDVHLAIAGDGRDRARLDRLATSVGCPVTFLGRVSDDRLADAYRLADLFVMMCRNRWFGLEQEGYGIVFLEAAACGVAQLAGRSGGSHEAVVDGTTGLVVDEPDSVTAVAAALVRLLADPAALVAMGVASRHRANSEASYESRAAVLAAALAGWRA